jgi:hypothetical protein
MPSEEMLNETEAIERLNMALAQQYRSALQYSIIAASLKGLEAQSLTVKLTEFGDEAGRSQAADREDHLL